MMQLKYAVAILLLTIVGSVNAAPQARLMPFWNHSNGANKVKINHNAWQQILNGYLIASDINRFNYAALKANKRNRNKLNAYIRSLEAINPRRYSKKVQKAYWINFYNALTVKVVVDNYPISSIKKIGWFGRGPWNNKYVTVLGKKLSLNNIEHNILRPIWRDNRIHYAVNCASLGCPNLAATAYTSANTESLLNNAAINYINHTRGVQFKGRKLVISRIYQWYQVDFRNVKQHLIKYAKPQLAKRLRNYRGSFNYDYNWTVNQL
ncbi:DUF547 domain-containing protein [Candidatus Marithrix sp. Canyon 246]|uniref:DUF547 domain-containing protein n=1 Tax=Candidatus Marithrix sp. Canyon 246 TaxID=1827136 RepID=UPI000849ED1C|nr:DUF547 domain-containing protein [Candidatus Marithrix sp. Canyon 246]